MAAGGSVSLLGGQGTAIAGTAFGRHHGVSNAGIAIAVPLGLVLVLDGAARSLPADSWHKASTGLRQGNPAGLIEARRVDQLFQPAAQCYG